MLIFLDTCEIQQVVYYHELGLVDGVTTNPTLVKDSGRDIFELLREICSIVKTSVSAEVVATEYNIMLKEAMKLREISEQITVKLPLTMDGLKTCKRLSAEGISTNVTLCFSPQQALMAAKAGATYVSLFVGRLEDIGQDGLGLVDNVRQIFDNYVEIESKILAASIRNANHVLQVAQLGADIITITPALLKTLVHHDLTDRGIEKFLNDWAYTNQRIIK
jgi:transaldolase